MNFQLWGIILCILIIRSNNNIDIPLVFHWNGLYITPDCPGKDLYTIVIRGFFHYPAA